MRRANNNYELAVTTPVKFYGYDTNRAKDSEAVCATAFIRELENKKTRHHWDDDTVIEHLQGCLRREAADWFRVVFPDDADRPTWAEFVNEFKGHYRIGGFTFSLNWEKLFRQESGEHVASYFARARSLLNQYCSDNSTRMYGHIAKFNAENWSLTALQNCKAECKTDDVVRSLISAMDEHQSSVMASIHSSVLQFITREMLFDGLADSKTREYAKNYVELHPREDFNRVLDRVIKWHESRHGHTTSSVAETTVEVEAIKPKTSKKTNKPNNKAKKEKDKSKVCKFCEAHGHTENECRVKSSCMRNMHKLKGAACVTEDETSAVQAATAGLTINEAGNECRW